MNEQIPTDTQVRGLWEKYGVKPVLKQGYFLPDKREVYPALTLDNLKEHIIPILIGRRATINLLFTEKGCVCTIRYLYGEWHTINKDSTLALFWTLEKLIDGGNNERYNAANQRENP